MGWFKNPPKEVYEELVEKTCNNFIPRVVGFDKWKEFFGSGNLTHIPTKKHPMTASSLSEKSDKLLAGFCPRWFCPWRDSADLEVCNILQPTRNSYQEA